MSDTNSITNHNKKYTHLDETERQLIEKWHKEGLNQTKIANRLGRNRSTISRELQRGQAKQVKQVNGYYEESV